MPDLAEQLRAYTDALVASTPPVARRRPPRRGAWLAVAAAVVVALVAVASAGRGDRDDASVVDAVPGPHQRVAAIDEAGAVVVFDLVTGERLAAFTDADDDGPVVSVAPSSDGTYLYLTRHVGTCLARIERVDLDTGQITIPVPYERGPAIGPVAVAVDKLAYTTGVCRTDDVPELVVANLDGTTWNGPAQLDGVVEQLTIAPDASRVAYVVDGRVEVFDPVYGTRVSLDTGDCAAPASPAFRPDGGLLAIVCDTVALFDPYSGERIEDLFLSGASTLTVSGDEILLESGDESYRWDGTSLVPLPFLDGTHAAVVIPDEPIEPPALPFGLELGPELDPDALDLPDVGVAVQLDVSDTVVLVDLDGDVLGHLAGYSLLPEPWVNPVLRGAGPLVLGHDDEAVVLDGTRFVPVPGVPGALPLADGAVLEPGDRTTTLRLASGERIELPFGEVVVSQDRDWVSVVVYENDVGYTVGAAYWLGNGEATSMSLGPGCSVGDDNGRVPVVLCGNRITIDDVVVSDGAGAPNGHWTAAQLSDVGSELLLQHSGECESQTSWRLDLASGDLAAVGPTEQAWDSGGLGWLPDGRAVVSFGPGVCGTVFPDGPGVYIESPDGSVELLYARPGGVTYVGAVLWRHASA